MTQAWAWVSESGHAAIQTVNIDREDTILDSVRIWEGGPHPKWFPPTRSADDEVFVACMADHGWHLKRVNVEPVEG